MVTESLERLEHGLALGRDHARPVVDDRDQDAVRPGSRPQHRRPLGRGVAQRVAQQVGERAFEQPGIGAQQRQAFGDVEPDRVRARQPVQRQRRDLLDRHRLDERLQRTGLQAAHVEQVGDQPVEPVGGVLDGREQLLLVILGVGDVGLPQAADARLDRCQRRTQVVADRGEKCGPHPVSGLERLGLRGLGAQPVAVE